MGFFELFSAALAGFYALVKSYGFAIILLTLAVRILLLPLSIKQTKSMREMQVIQPEIKRLQAKHKGDRQKLNEEMMKLYKEHGVNPFGGCLPLLMQFPVLIGLFYVVRTPLQYMGFMKPPGSEGAIPLHEWVLQDGLSGFIETLSDSALARDLIDHTLSTNSFLGLRLDCSSSAALSGGNPLPIPGNPCGDGFLDALPYLVLVLLMGATTYYQQKQMQASRGPQDNNPQAQQMQMFMRIMPIMLMVFSFNFPTGVVMYWLTTNVWTIAQQRIILKAAPPINLSGGDSKAASKQKTVETTAAVKPKGTSDGGGQKKNPSKPHPSSKKKRKR
jgi:YidC/Oxa1 family membrane protein insertase